MSDYVVTVPKSFTHPDAPGKRGLAAWIAEGDAAPAHGAGADSDTEWWFETYGPLPIITTDSRLYIVCEGRLRGYAPIVRVMYDEASVRCGQSHLAFIRRGGAVAVTIDELITGFRGVRRRWWDRSIERPFPDWRTP